LTALKKFTPELDERLEKVINSKPTQAMNWRKWAPNPDRR
jgi:hypothetical protein